MPNWLMNSEDFTTTWIELRSTVTANQIAAPDGSTNADLITDSTALGEHSVRQVVNEKRGVVERWSAFADLKADTLTAVRLLIGDIGTADSARCDFDLSAGTAGATVIAGGFSDALADIRPLGDDWYRCFLSAFTNPDPVVSMRLICVSSGTANYAGVGQGVYAFGANLSPGLPGRYISTGAVNVRVDPRIVRHGAMRARKRYQH